MAPLAAEGASQATPVTTLCVSALLFSVIIFKFLCSSNATPSLRPVVLSQSIALLWDMKPPASSFLPYFLSFPSPSLASLSCTFPTFSCGWFPVSDCISICLSLFCCSCLLVRLQILGCRCSGGCAKTHDTPSVSACTFRFCLLVCLHLHNIDDTAATQGVRCLKGSYLINPL